MGKDCSDKTLRIILAAIGVSSLAFAVAIYVGTLNPSSRSSDGGHTAAAVYPWDVEDVCASVRSFIDSVNASCIDANHYYLTRQTHVAGSARDFETAEWMNNVMKDASLPSRIDTYNVMLSQQNGHNLKAWWSNGSYDARLEEAIIDEDPSSGLSSIPTMHGYAPSGNVTGEVVYVNYGHQSDFEYLSNMGVDLKGKIALARYGQNFRGIKVEMAEKYGMAGVLIYSDPADSGFSVGPEVPEGPFGTKWSVQRGSVHFLQLGPGDPTTPFFASTPENEGRRLGLDEIETLPSIPSQPISWGDAEPILRTLAGMKAPEHWQGGLPFEYYIGPGPVKVNLFVNSSYIMTPIWNVMGMIEGSEEPDRWVVLGNHRDAWTFGGVDPSSGSAPMAEIARAVGDLVRAGWRPRRSIVLGNWDAEEWALVGSTEYVEDHYDEIRNKVVAYLNVDEAVVGQFSFRLLSTPSLSDFLINVAKHIPIPEHIQERPLPSFTAGSSASSEEGAAPVLCRGCSTVYEYWLHGQSVIASRSGSPPPPSPWSSNVGSGSDYTPFFQFAGVPSCDLRFTGDYSGYGVYHSNYDSYSFVSKQLDPGFGLHKALAQYWGAAAMILADTEVLPFNYVAYGVEMKRGLAKFAAEVEEKGLTSGVLKAAYTQLSSAVSAFSDAASALNSRLASLRSSSTSVSPSRISEVNDALMSAERAFLSSEGLPGREWYRHFIFAPAMDLGYGAATFPAVMDGVLNYNSTQIEEGVRLTVERIEAATLILSSTATVA